MRESKENPEKKAYFPIDAFELPDNFISDPLMTSVKLARYKFVAKMLAEDDIVLDLGCGNGYSSYFFSKFAKKVIGVDLYANLKKANAVLQSDNLMFVKADILSPPSEILEEKYSAIVAIDVIEHFYKEDGERIIGQYSRYLTDNGMMIFGTPSKFSQSYRSPKSKDTHFYEYEPDELNMLCRRFFGRTILFSMNDEIVHTGFKKLAWFFFVLCFK
jgi:2-polyprenyl-3-methyl-5-hydroxy-6-metoxy-1,4-benzoquinol methylase